MGNLWGISQDFRNDYDCNTDEKSPPAALSRNEGCSKKSDCYEKDEKAPAAGDFGEFRDNSQIRLF